MPAHLQLPGFAVQVEWPKNCSFRERSPLYRSSLKSLSCSVTSSTREHWDSVYATCADLLTALKAGTEPATSATDNLKTFALCEAAYESMATRRVIKM